MFQYDTHYEIKRMGENEMSHIVLTQRSPYRGVEYQYGAVRLEEGDDELIVNFEYEVFSNPKGHKVNVGNEEFRNYIGAILIEILEQELTYETSVRKK